MIHSLGFISLRKSLIYIQYKLISLKTYMLFSFLFRMLFFILHNNLSFPSLPWFYSPHNPPKTPSIHSSERIMLPMVIQQSLALSVEAGPKPCVLEWGWTKHSTIENGLQKAANAPEIDPGPTATGLTNRAVYKTVTYM